MNNYTILYDCNWDSNYPINHTCGEFPLQADNDLEVIFYITRKFLHHPSLLGYHFIIDGEETAFEIKMGA